LKQLDSKYNFPRLTTSGLPVIIGTRDRRAIISGSASIIKMYLSLFGIYRLISTDVEPKLESITDSFNGDQSFLDVALL
jgi:hypothetical protein